MKKFPNLNAKESIGFDIPIYKNALQLKKDAELIAHNRKSYSSATSLLILSTEEVIKSILVKLHSEGYKIYKSKDVFKFFFNHKIRHQIAQLFELMTGLLDSINFYEQEKSDLTNKHWFKKFFIVLFDIAKSISPLLESLEYSKKLQNFDYLKNRGFYVDFQNSLITPQKEITKEQYDETLTLTNRIFSFSKSLRILHHPNAENHIDLEEIEETKIQLKEIIDEHVGTFSFKEMNKTMDKL